MKIAIIGAGPAGIFGTLLLKDFAGEVHLFEQNKRLGEKLRLTGGGRMNITNRQFGSEHFTSSSLQLLKNLFKSPWIEKREEIFRSVEMEYRWEGDRAILASQNAGAEVDRLANLITSQKNVVLHTGSKVRGIEKEGNRFVLEYEESAAKWQKLECDIVVLAGGGMFRIRENANTESEIYALPLALGHSIVSPSPSLSPLLIPNSPLAELAGTAFRGVLMEGKQRTAGEILITHQGLSGPAVLDFSAFLQEKEAELAFLDVSEEEFTSQFQVERSGKHLLRTLLRSFLSQKLADWHMQNLNIPQTAIIAEISKELATSLRKQLFHFPLREISLMDYSYCWTSKGGIPLSEIHVSTLESKLIPNLFFAGEILDVNGLCGGYNISFAAISAKLVANAIGKKT